MAPGRLPIVDQRAPGVTSHAFEARPLPPRPGPVETALRDLWTPAVRRRLARPGHWRDLWQLWRRYDLVEVRADEFKPDFPIGRLPDCESCDEVCCTGPHRVVLLRLMDVAAFMDAGLTGFITLDKPEFSAAELRRNVNLWDLVHSEAWRCLPVLRQDATRTCMLLTADNRCGAWPSWPLSCARFPYSLDLLRGRLFFAASCGSRRQDPSPLGRAEERRLTELAVEAYNQRLRDAVLMRVARRELQELGLTAHLRLP